MSLAPACMFQPAAHPEVGSVADAVSPCCYRAIQNADLVRPAGLAAERSGTAAVLAPSAPVRAAPRSRGLKRRIVQGGGSSTQAGGRSRVTGRRLLRQWLKSGTAGVAKWSPARLYRPLERRLGSWSQSRSRLQPKKPIRYVRPAEPVQDPDWVIEPSRQVELPEMHVLCVGAEMLSGWPGLD